MKLGLNNSLLHTPAAEILHLYNFGAGRAYPYA